MDKKRAMFHVEHCPFLLVVGGSSLGGFAQEERFKLLEIRFQESGPFGDMLQGGKSFRDRDTKSQDAFNVWKKFRGVGCLENDASGVWMFFLVAL